MCSDMLLHSHMTSFSHSASCTSFQALHHFHCKKKKRNNCNTLSELVLSQRWPSVLHILAEVEKPQAVNTWKHWMKTCRHNLDIIQEIVPSYAGDDKANDKANMSTQHWQAGFEHDWMITCTAEWQRTRRGNEVMKVYPVQFCKSLLWNGTKITFPGTLLRGPSQTSHLGNPH